MDELFSVRGKTAVVTGGSRGIGAAPAELAAAAGPIVAHLVERGFVEPVAG